MRYEFFLPMKIPSITHQEKRIAVKNGKPVVYEDARLKDARQKFIAYLAQHKPERPMDGAVRLCVVWGYKPKDGKMVGRHKVTKPDLDNLIKLFKDCMTMTGFWKDDAQVADEQSVKVYGSIPGVYVMVEEIEEVQHDCEP